MPRGRAPNTLTQNIMAALRWFAGAKRCAVCAALIAPGRGGDLCEKHYMRRLRTGTTAARLPQVCSSSGGYLIEYAPDHILAGPGGTVYQHRRVFYDEHGDGPFTCAWCGTGITWETMHVDHVNNKRADNRPLNLVAACKPCNHDRGHMIKFINKAALYRPQSMWAKFLQEICNG